MSGEDYQDLQKFGTNIKDKSNNISKIKLKKKLLNSEKLNRTTKGSNKEKKICKNKLLVKTKNISKLVTVAGKWANKKLNPAVDKDYRLEKRKGSIISKTQSKHTKKGLQYRLIETRKQRGNKTIVIRKRILVKPSNGELQLQGIKQKTLFEYGCDYSQVSGDTSYKQSFSSIWDMPVEIEEKKEKYKKFLYF